MACLIFPEATKDEGYEGLASIFEYVNDDGKCWRSNCGLAAAATMVTHHQLSPLKADLALMAELERDFPPDIFGGHFGTSRTRVRHILRAYGCRLEVIASEAALRARLDLGRPVVVMLAVSQGKLFNRFDLPGGHWMVAYGYDQEFVYLTNWGKMTWSEFNQGWNGIVPALIGMRRRGLVAYK